MRQKPRIRRHFSPKGQQSASKLQYLGAEVQYYQAEGARKSADTALLQAMLDYDWAVQGFVSVPQ